MHAVVLWLLALSAPRLALADDVLDIPPSCGSQSELTREIDALRARQALTSPRPDVRLAPGDAGFVLEIALPDGTRTLRDVDCRALFRAAIVIAALGHDLPAESDAAAAAPRSDADGAPAPAPSAVHDVPAQAPPPPPAVAAPSPAPTTASKTPEPPRERSRSPAQAFAFLQVEAAHGVVPDWYAALAAGAHWRRGLWGVRGWFGYLTPKTAREQGSAVRVQALDLAASLELWPLRGLGVGLGMDLFLVRGQGVDVADPRVDWTAQPAPHLALRARIWGGERGVVELTGRALWSPQPSRFRLENEDTLYEAEAFAFQLGLAGSLQFL